MSDTLPTPELTDRLRAIEERFPIGTVVRRKAYACPHNAVVQQGTVQKIVVCGIHRDVWIKVDAFNLLDPDKYELKRSQVNKFFLGSVHVCATEEEQKSFARTIQRKAGANRRRLEEMR